jgi:UDP-N-acetylglucosamine diphosphorylase / glucose-1-phosphate thymidylyltransferase / UDP-N-acetylgalactosamine diphosphorylase / glucosamine-1-phosphate N-acetyltransferase / galactosamine-1-phosphate N-acetyltransferase
MLAVVLAAGRGTRLRHLTEDRSKAMLPIAGKPMVERVLEMLSRGGVERFIVVAHPDDDPLVEHLSRPPWAGRVRLAYQEQRLGMAHAVECAAPLVQEEDAPAFILASCDNLYPEGHVAALIARQREDELDAVLTLLWVRPEQASATAVVVLQDGWVTDIIEKPRPEEIPSDGERAEALTAPALYVLSNRVLDYLPRVRYSPRGEREFPEALRLLIEDGGRASGLLVQERLTLTQPTDLLAINAHFLRHDPACAAVEADLPSDVCILPPVRIEAGVELGAGCRIGPEVYLEAGCRIGAEAVLRRAVVLRGATVKAGMVVEETLSS